jgi:uncharacterized repeat protein (TIGR03806 family)
MKKLLSVVTSIVLLALSSSCDSCAPAEGEGEPAEGEGEGEGDPPDAGPPDPNVVGLDARPSNTTCTAPDRPALGGDLDVVEPWPNLNVNSPLLMLQEPGSSRMYVIERGGRIVRFEKDDANVTNPEVFGDIAVATTDSGNDERGLLGMAFHPDWPAVQEVFLSYEGFGVNQPLSNIVSRFQVVNDFLDESSEEQLLFLDDFASNHNGGMIAFSPTDPCRTCLYAGTGDGGDANDDHGGIPESGQNPGVLFSKILRIDVDARTDALPYGIPADNPFIDDSSFVPETWAWGFRNPWRWSFDRSTGDLWLGDVGQGSVEEIDRVERGGNYGWNTFEGNSCFDNSNNDCARGGFEAPVVTYQHGGGRISVTGGYVYNGAAIPSLQGFYLFADFGTGEIFKLVFDDQANATAEVALDLSTNIASFSEDGDGELYVLDHVTGRIQKIVAAGPAPVDTFPKKLSETGCVNPNDATQPASGLIPYTVNHALYSDGAKKDRFVALPDGQQAHILDDGDIDFPIGTVFIKNFTVGNQKVETRLLVKHADGDWGGYSYEWNDAGTDADLLPPAGKTKTLNNGQQWTYPSRNGCLACHTDVAHRQLGWELSQLNGGFVYESTGRFANQLHTLDAIGVFDNALPAPLDQIAAFPPVDDVNASVESKARAYLHVNCAICHRPGGIGVANTDWRATTSFADMGLCNAQPTEGNLGVDGALRLVPGDPAHSLVSIRMKRLGAGRMPLLGSVIVDEQGTGVIDSWISSIQACP